MVSPLFLVACAHATLPIGEIGVCKRKGLLNLLAGFLGGTRALARGEPKPEAAPLQRAEGLAPKQGPRLRA